MKLKSCKKFLSLFILILCLNPFHAATSAPSSSSQRNTGIGVILGEPTGLTAKFWQNHNNAIDLGLAFSFNSFVLIYSDYLFHFPKAFGNRTAFLRELRPYIGIGGELLISDTSNRTDGKYFTSNGSSVGVGVRIPFGIEWLVASAPLGIFVELTPLIGIIPSTFGTLQGGIGARYYL